MENSKTSKDAENSEETTPCNYEFTEEQNKIISDLSNKVRFVGITLVIACILLGITASRQNELFFPIAMYTFIWFLISFSHLLASSGLKKIVVTQGNDIDHLMNSLGSFSKCYLFYYWAFAIWVISMVYFGIIYITKS